MVFKSLNLKNNDSLMVNVIIYLVSAVFVALIFCYSMFSLKAYLENQNINDIDKKMAALSQQKAYESKVSDYKKKVDDYNLTINNHKISSNIFSFMEEKTLPNVWFSSFDMSQINHEVNVSGETDSMEVLSRQVQSFENSEFVKGVTVLSSQTQDSGKVQFALIIHLDPKIFDYKISPLSVSVSPAENQNNNHGNQ